MTYDYADHAPKPWAHQDRFFLASRDMEHAALLMEQRTGKSRVVVDTAAYQYEKGNIDALLILAPNNVHMNWLTESIPQFMPHRIPTMLLGWRSGKMQRVQVKRDMATLLAFDGLAVLSINYDALLTNLAKGYLAKFLRKRKLLIVADESDDLAHPGAKRTQVAMHAGKWGKFRRILTGTPATETPFAFYSQTNFLKFGVLGFTSFLAFKHHHAEFETGYNHNTETEYESVARDAEGHLKYLHMDELSAKLAKFSFRITREECGGQVPTYVPRKFELHPEQRRVYEQLREEYRAELATLRESGTVTAAHVLQRYTRLQQVTSGFVPLDREAYECPACRATDPACVACSGLGVVVPEPQVATLPNTRLEALETHLRGTTGQVVVWARFTADIQAVNRALTDKGCRVGLYFGGATEDARLRDKEAFMAGKLDVLISNPQAGGRGLDFSVARTCFFYSHHWSLKLRLQAQDRIESLNRKDPTTVVDLIAEDTVDEHIIDSHINKRLIQDELVGDKPHIWL